MCADPPLDANGLNGAGATVDEPRERQRPNPEADLRRQKQYVRRMAKQFGWRIQT